MLRHLAAVVAQFPEAVRGTLGELLAVLLLEEVGLVGLAMSTTPAVALGPLVSGVLSGFTLLAATLSNPLRQLARLRT